MSRPEDTWPILPRALIVLLGTAAATITVAGMRGFPA